VANYEYFGTTSPNQDHLHEELGADEMLVVWHHSVHIRMPSSILSKMKHAKL
jgi:hypothetical protein